MKPFDYLITEVELRGRLAENRYYGHGHRVIEQA